MVAFGSKGFGGIRRGRSESERLRRIISAETRHRGDIARDGKAGEGGPLRLFAVVPLLEVDEVEATAGEGAAVGLYEPREGSEDDRESLFTLGSGSVSMLDDFVLDSRFMSSEEGVDAIALACCQARRSSHLRTSDPNVRSIDNSRIRSFSFFRRWRSWALADRASVKFMERTVSVVSSSSSNANLPRSDAGIEGGLLLLLLHSTELEWDGGAWTLGIVAAEETSTVELDALDVRLDCDCCCGRGRGPRGPQARCCGGA